MSKNLIKKGLAFGAVLSLGVTGFTGIAASAATGDVTLAPNTGTKYGSLATESFSVKTTVSSLVSPTNLAYSISNPDKTSLYIKVGSLDGSVSAATADRAVTLTGYTALGAAVTDLDLATGGSQSTFTIVTDGATDGFATAESQKFGEFTVDFATLGITKLVISGIGAAGASNVLSVQPVEETIAAGTSVLSSSAAAPVGATDGLDFGDGDASVSVQSWVESEATADYSTVDAAYASENQKLTFVDPKSVTMIPRVESFVKADGTALLNAAGAVISGSIELPSSINLDQVDVTPIVLKDGSTALTETYAAPVGFTSLDAAGRLYFTATETSTLDTAISLNVKYNNAAAALYTGVSYTPVAGTSDATVAGVQATVTDSSNAIQTNATDTAIELRPATKSFTYKAQILDQTAAAATGHTKAVSSVKVIAVVKATSYLSATGSYTVSGANGSIAKLNRAVISSGVTDSNGQFSVTVTSATALADEAFSVTFYVVKSDGTVQASGGYTSTYTAASVSSLSADNEVLSGSSVTVKFTVKDTYSQATAKSGTDALFIRVQGSSTANLDKDIAVGADGTASITFANYVATSGSDNITAKVYKGTASVPGTALATKVLTLFNPAAVAAVNVPATTTTNITYDDFVTGAASATNVGPNDGGVAVSGTVVDANSVGVPGAVVTISGKGLQFQKNGGTEWFLDSITLNADAGGNYNVTVYSHVVNTTGVAVTVTSGGKSATTNLKTYLPTGLDGNNIVFSLAVPATIVKNTTYALTAKLADKWGNPVATSTTGVNFQGTGSVEINSVSTAVAKTFDKNGQALVFVRSVKDIAGPGAITATLAAGSYSATSAAAATALTIAEIATDVTATKWDETKFKNSIETNVEVLNAAPSPAASSNASGSTGKFYASATNAAGKKVVVKVNGVFAKSFIGTAVKKVISVTASKGTKTITIYVGGKLSSTKVVIVK